MTTRGGYVVRKSVAQNFDDIKSTALWLILYSGVIMQHSIELYVFFD